MSNSFFSERYGYKKIDIDMLKNYLPKQIKTRIWNVFYKSFFQDIDTIYILKNINKKIEVIITKFFKLDLSGIFRMSGRHIVDRIKKLFFSLEWYEVYDFIEFVLNEPLFEFFKQSVKEKINKILKEEKVPYCIVEQRVIPQISEEEIKEIEKVIGLPDKFKPVKEHLKNALEHISNRKAPNYADSIKQSISALESLVQILLEKKGTLGKLIDELNVHPALKEGFKKLYGWTSDDGGIRHGKYKEKFEPGIAEARYMLVTVSAFINYLINKYSDSTLENF